MFIKWSSWIMFGQCVPRPAYIQPVNFYLFPAQLLGGRCIDRRTAIFPVRQKRGSPA